jgi:hypothetical protein
MKEILDSLTAALSWIKDYGPTIGALVMAATTWFYRWRNIVHQQSLQTVVNAVEKCDAGTVKRAVEVAPKTPASQTAIEVAKTIAEVNTQAANAETKP